MDVTGWLSAKARTGPGMVPVGTNAELMNGRKMSGEENAPAPSTDLAVSPGMPGAPGEGGYPRQRQGEQERDAADREPRQRSRPRAEAHGEGDEHDDHERD